VKFSSRLFAICLASACVAACLLASVAQAAAPVPAWKSIAASAPTNLPPVQSEVQRVAVDAEGGTYTLTASTPKGKGTGVLPSNAKINFFKLISGSFSVGDRVVGDYIVPGTTVTAVQGSGDGSAGSQISLSQQPTGPVSASVTVYAANPSATTLPIAFDEKASEPGGPVDSVQEKLEALSTIGSGNVTVAGGPGNLGGANPYFISYTGTADLPPLEANSTGLSGGIAHTVNVSTALDGGPGTTTIMLYVQNVGGLPSSATEETTLKVTLPPGIKTAGSPDGGAGGAVVSKPFWGCTIKPGPEEEIECKTLDVFTPTFSLTKAVAGPGFTLPVVKVPVASSAGVEDGVVGVEVSGGGVTGTTKYEMPLIVSALPAPPGLQSYTAATYRDDGVVDDRAGAHPYSASTGILINTVRAPKTGKVIPAGEFRDIVVNTPPGFFGNPIATPQCPESTAQEDCPQQSIVATAQIPLQILQGNAESQELSSVNNIEAPYGYPAKFRFVTGFRTVTVNVAASLRSDEDYGLEIGSYNTPQIKPVYGAFFTIWGTPADDGHDGQRCTEFKQGEPLKCDPEGGEQIAFLTNPLDCSEEALRPPVATIKINTWQNPGLLFRTDVPIPPVSHCDQLEFKSSSPGHPGVDFTFEPADTKADSPTSFRTELKVPSEGLLDPDQLMTPTIRESVVELPKGVVLNASAADGLQACSKEQIGLLGTNFPRPNEIRFSKDPQTCPTASKIGTGELKSELIEDPLQGDLYLAAQGDGNPFGSLFAIYLVIEDPRHGIFVKLPGEVQVNEGDGQQRIVFRDLPPLPFNYLRLTLKGGSRSPLASPSICGNYVTTATNTPWSAPESGPAAVSANGFDVNQGPNGLPCANTLAERPFDIGWKAGAESVKAGASGPFQMQITRPDGSQELTGLSVKTPPGVSASLKGIPQCTEAQIEAVRNSTGKAELASSACPAASKVGTLTTGAGSGPSPFYVSGNLYLAGPYKGAPLSVVAITPAVAGPFDLGNVVVRSAVSINRTTAQVSANTDEIPQFLKGVALRIRDVRIKLDRDNWTINPTSCDESTVNLSARGASGAVAERSTRFQVGDCESLGFAPKLSAKVIGGTKRGKHPAFEASLTYPAGSYANLKNIQVALPHSEFLDQAHINTICTRPQAAANACPAGAIYGYAEATTPLLDGKLTGPVFLKSSVHKLPDLAIFLRGPDSQPIEVEFQGRIDSIKGQIRNTIEGLPDVPVSSFTLKMKGGKKGLLINSRDLCKGKPGRLTVKMVAQNNKSSETRPVLGNSCSKKSGKAKKHKRAAAGKSSRLLAALHSAW
jgi:hypothetical protein